MSKKTDNLFKICIWVKHLPYSSFCQKCRDLRVFIRETLKILESCLCSTFDKFQVCSLTHWLTVLETRLMLIWLMKMPFIFLFSLTRICQKLMIILTRRSPWEVFVLVWYLLKTELWDLWRWRIKSFKTTLNATEINKNSRAACNGKLHKHIFINTCCAAIGASFPATQTWSTGHMSPHNRQGPFTHHHWAKCVNLSYKSPPLNMWGDMSSQRYLRAIVSPRVQSLQAHIV